MWPFKAKEKAKTVGLCFICRAETVPFQVVCDKAECESEWISRLNLAVAYFMRDRITPALGGEMYPVPEPANPEAGYAIMRSMHWQETGDDPFA